VSLTTLGQMVETWVSATEDRATEDRAEPSPIS
jgi:hypothetical protein